MRSVSPLILTSVVGLATSINFNRLWAQETSAADSLLKDIPISAITALIVAIGVVVAILTYLRNRRRDACNDIAKAKSLALKVERTLAEKALKVQKGQPGSGLNVQEMESLSILINEALAIAPKSSRVQAVSGSFYNAIGNMAKAETAYRKAIDLDRNDPHSHLNMFLFLMRAGKEDEAIQYLSSARAHARCDPEVFADIGMVLEVIDRNDEAESVYREGLSIDPSISKLWYNFGNLLTKSGKYKEAHDALEMAASINPSDPEIFCNFGNACSRIGNTGKAIEMLEHAVRLDPTYALAYRNLALAYQSAERVEDSEAAYRIFQELDKQ